ncbi:MAG: formate hydrogenlyase [Betaproteobacteria bacterium]|nr:formate hydrogenlyase [Betaproteobacteria bacterium]
MWHILRRVARVGPIPSEVPEDASAPAEAVLPVTRRDALDDELLRLLRRALAVRVVDAGSCNGCEFELAALSNPYYNLEGRGVHFVASPRHADVLLVTGPVTLHMREALLRTYEAMPEPRLVVAVGDCAACGGEFAGSYAVCGGVAEVLPVDLQVPGCPAAPLQVLQGLLQVVRQRA